MDKRIQGKNILIILGCAVIIMGSVILFLCAGYLGDKRGQKTIFCDINQDGTDEKITLCDQKITITEDDNLLWESQEEWEVTDFLISDINKDGWEEILILLWKQGNYGEYTPFWEENDDEFSQHIFIYQWKEQRLKPLWMSSGLKPRIKEWSMMEDGRIHIITDKDEDTMWIWGNWGLERVK